MMKMIKPSQVTDSTQWSAYMHGDPLSRQWDNGFGPLWVYRCSIAVLGVVRAKNWEEAYETVVDEIMDDGTYEDAIEGLTAEQIANGELNEGYIYRGSGQPSNPKLTSSIASEDLNGSDLRELTDDLAADLRIDIWDTNAPQGLLPPETSRFDVVAAYYLIAKDWYSGGGSIGYRKLCQAMRHLGGNIDALERDDSARSHAAALLWKRRREIRRSW